MQLVRLGYSLVESQTHIRPHWGPTNTQIKAHLGLAVPRQPDGGRCTSLRVGDEEREWEVGKALLFDDRWARPSQNAKPTSLRASPCCNSWIHEVYNNCTESRLVLQAVFAHPALVGADAPPAAGDAAVKQDL